MDRDGEDGSPSQTGPGDISLDVIPLHSTNLLTVLDPSGVVQYESPAIERIYGFDQEELVGEPVAEFFHPEDRDTVVESFQTVVTSDNEVIEAVEYRHRMADGSYCWVESVASSNPTPAGHYVVNTRDISERKAYERELERSNERLSEFASIISHDLRNPLQVAAGRLELAREDCESEHLASAEAAIKRSENLIQDLLVLTREGGDLNDTQTIALEELIADVWKSAQTGAATLNIDIDRTIEGRRQRLERLFENLVRNAIDHGGQDVTITVGETPTGIYIADDGSGIPEAEWDAIFETGYTTRDDGTGLGLNIVAEIAEMHDWELQVTDSERGGAKFEIDGVEFTD